MHTYRSHRLNELNEAHVGERVKLSGWVDRTRDHGQLVFVDLRDHYGITQCVAESDHALFETLTHLRNESVVTIEGEVVKRSEETTNTDLPTGHIEVKIDAFMLESEAETPLPVLVNNDEADFPEATRLEYRFLDLRREKLHQNIVLRAQVIQELRWSMIQQGFTEIQTPILTASSPEGARDYLVPSRVHPGKFYALPQAPQMFKQLLMTSGFDKYFQIAPCFRDEDARADRSPGEFYQLDMEMAFCTQEDVFAVIEPVMENVFTKFGDKNVTPAPFPRIPYDEAMLSYGSDKPDLRNPIKIIDASSIWQGSGFGIFNKVIEGGGIVRAIPAPGTAEKPRSFFDKMIAYAQENGAKGLAYIIYDADGNGKGPIAKFLTDEKHAELKASAGLKPGDAIFFSSGSTDEAATIAGIVRGELGRQLELINDDEFKFCWIVDFPFYEWDEDRKCIDFSHNPFSMPQGGLEALEEAGSDNEKLLALKAFQYDIVCNGIELSSGAIRNHKPEIMKKAFGIVGYSEEDVAERFGSLWRAFHYGAPPHGGIAPGVDRMIMLLADEPNIREVIAFPMNQRAEDLLMGAPAPADERHLKELNLQLSPKARKALDDKEDAQGEAA